MNNVSLVGRLTRAPEVRYDVDSEEEKAVARFALAIYRNTDITEFISCVAFNKTAKTVETYCKKGMLIAVDGSLHTYSWQDEEGKTRKITEVWVNRIYFTESR